ncbi:MAG: hypothetical protein ACI9OJ_004594 [Myxococcota bacterium]|jgi:hypothetical protein
MAFGSLVTGLVLILAASGCRRNQSRASAAPAAPVDVDMVETPIHGVGNVLLPAGWHYTQSEYSSRYGNQAYRTVQALVRRGDEDAGMLSIDISPSHPRLWRKPLSDHIDSRLKALKTHGPTVSLDAETPELPYEAEQRMVSVGSDLRTVFRVFRQRSRVVTVAYTATTDNFEPKLGRRLVRQASDSLHLDLPTMKVKPPNLNNTELSNIAGALSAEIPAGWELRTHRLEPSAVPAETLELMPADADTADDPPTLTLAIVHVSALGPDVQIEGLVDNPTGPQSLGRADGPRATVFEVDHDTLAAARVLQVGNDILTVTYAAPDYLFEVKPALALLKKIAETVELHPR